jgi:sugar O-acyltransferase (sialic acid O-acetyltransferase NeuD family)
MDKPVIIFGAKGIAKAALEIFESNSFIVYGFLDDDKELHNAEINTIPVLGHPDDHGFLKLIGQKCEAFVASDDNQVRQDTVSFLVDTRKVMPVNAIHQQSFIPESSSIGHGNYIGSGVRFGTNVAIGQHCIVNTGAIIDYEVVLGDFVQLGAGSIINAGVKVEKGAFIGSGAVIVSGVTIGENARIGAGSVVISDVNEGETVFGNPAKLVS